MKYMMMVKIGGNSAAGRNYDAGLPPPAELEAAMGKLIEKMLHSGVLVDTGGLLPPSQGARIRAAGGKLSITDGPFIESKEVIGGYAVLQVKSKEEAIRYGEDFMKVHVDILGPSYAGELDIREMFDPAEGGCGCPPQKSSATSPAL